MNMKCCVAQFIGLIFLLIYDAINIVDYLIVMDRNG